MNLLSSFLIFFKIKKAPNDHSPGALLNIFWHGRSNSSTIYRSVHTNDIFFFHPDFTVGTGISPVQSLCKEGVADYTADREFHPAPKKIVSVFNCKDTTKSDEFIRNLLMFLNS